MKKAFLPALLLLATYHPAYSEDAPLKIQSSIVASEPGSVREGPTPKPAQIISVTSDITNTTNSTQIIGVKICGADSMQDWVTDNPVFLAIKAACPKNTAPDVDVSLKPGETRTETCQIAFFVDKAASDALDFHIGLPVNGKTSWSNPLNSSAQP